MKYSELHFPLKLNRTSTTEVDLIWAGLKKERENLAHNIMSVEINQDIIPKANNLHDKYLKDRKAVQETIDIFDSSVFACMEKLKNMQKQGTASKWLKGGK